MGEQAEAGVPTAWRWDRWLALIVGCLGVVLAAVAHRDAAFLGDQNNYLGGAESLAAGKGYREAYVVGEPRCTIYPPLFSSYLSLGFRAGGPWPQCLEWVAAGQWLLSGATGFLTYLVLRQQGVASRWAVPWTVLFLSSGCWHLMVNGLFSESLMQPLFLGLLAWLGRKGRQGVGYGLGVGILLSAIYLTRSASTAIVGGALLVTLLHFRRLGWWRVFAVGLPVMLAVLGWRLWTQGAGMTYASSFVEVVRDGLGIPGYVRLIGRNVLSVATGWDVLGAVCPMITRGIYHPLLAGTGATLGLRVLLGVLGGAGMFFVLVGIWQSRKQSDPWVAGIISLYLIQNILWWYWLGDRGMLILLPLFVIWAHRGLRTVATHWMSLRALRRGVAGALAVGLLLNLFLAVRTGKATARTVERVEIEETAAWVREHVGTQDVLVASSDIPLPHFTHAAGRQVVGVAKSQIAVVPGVPPTHAVVRTQPNRYMPQPEFLGETLFTSAQGTFAVRRVTR